MSDQPTSTEGSAIRENGVALAVSSLGALPPMEAGREYEKGLAAAPRRRRELGAFYTPERVVEGLLDFALRPLLECAPSAEAVRALRVVDPACGTGNFLVGIAPRLAARLAALRGFRKGAMRDAAACLAGRDIDGAALAICRERLRGLCEQWGDEPGRVDLRELDALAEPAESERFDLVIGNPPFLNQLERGTAATGKASAALRRRFGAAKGAYTDSSACFLLAGLELLRPGGMLCMIQPVSLLSARDAAGVRRESLRRCALTHLWIARERAFDAGVHVCAVVLREGGLQGDVQRRTGGEFIMAGPVPGAMLRDRETWGPLAADLVGIPCPAALAAGAELPGGAVCIGDVADATADFRDEYYGLKDALVESESGNLPKIITSGLIDLAGARWGRTPARLHGRAWSRPRADLSKMEPRLAARAEAKLVPKLLLATQTGVLEVVADEAGELLPVTPVVSILPRPGGGPESLWRLGAALASPPLSAIAAARYFGAALTPTAIKLSASQVLRLPLPRAGGPDAEEVEAAWAEGARAFRLACNAEAGRDVHLERAATAMCAAYGLRGEDAAELLAWWRLRRRGRRAAEGRGGDGNAGKDGTAPPPRRIS